MKIETKQILIGGEKFYAVKKVMAKLAEELPTKYLNSDTYVAQKESYKYASGHKDGICVYEHGKNIFSIVEGFDYTEKDLEKYLKILSECKETLRKINIQLNMENAGWNKDVTFQI